MNHDDAQNLLKTSMATPSQLEKLRAELEQKSQQAQIAIRATREQEEAQLRQAMVVMFQDQQQRTEAALHPQIARAWQVLAALVGIGVRVFGGFLLLLDRASDRLRTAEARADAAEVQAEVQEASRHVEITSCGGRPCIHIDKSTPIWKSGSSEYILVDGKPGKGTGKRQ